MEATMPDTREQSDPRQRCRALQDTFFASRSLIIAANRGPVTFQTAEDGSRSFTRGAGGLVTALTGLAQQIDATWIACARTEADMAWGQGDVPMGTGKHRGNIRVQFLAPEPEAYDRYYNVIANPLLWFLQHSMWNMPLAPVIDRSTWLAWDDGYVAINQLFADAIVEQVRANGQPTLVMLQDYHFYLAPRMVRGQMRPSERPVLMHFVHIPWPGAEYWRILPPAMRGAILEGLCGADIVGFQTHADALNFMRTCQTHLNRVGVRYGRGRVWYRNHATHVRAFPVSIDVGRLKRLARSQEVAQHRVDIENLVGDCQLILRIERIEPSKNIVRGFQAFGEMLELYPEHRGKVKFLALLVPSRLDVDEYRAYLDAVMAAAGQINAHYGSSNWEPVRVLVGESYPRAVAAMQRYDALLVNATADGMNLVAKEGPVVNRRDGTLVLSEGTGAREQLEPAALVIPACDIYATANALHRALVMPAEERRERGQRLRTLVEENDIEMWLCSQLETVTRLKL